MTLDARTAEIDTKIDDLFSAILLEQQKYQGLKAPDAGKENLIEEKLKEYSTYRGRGFFYNYFSSGRGHGPFSEQIDGSIKYDLIGGIGVNLLGHSHPIYIKSNIEAATTDTLICGNLLTYNHPKVLTEALIKSVAGSPLKNFWFAGSGSFANDCALKMLWQKCSPKYNLIAFQRAFAGRSIATQDITYNEAYREGQPRSIQVRHALHYDQNDPDNALKKSLDSLNAIWDAEPDSFCGMMIEIIQGEAGYVYGTKEYYEEIFNWAKAKGIYIWVDEVQSWGRTHQMFAFQHFGLDKYIDLCTVGKCLQSCGVFYSEELNPKPGLIAGTFNASIAALNAGAKTLKYLSEGNFYGPSGKSAHIEKKMAEGFEKLRQGSCKGKLGYSGGIGTMVSFEVGDASSEINTAFVKKLYENGVIGFVAGKNPYRTRFLLPLALTDEHIDEIFQVIEKTVLEVVK